MAVHKIDFTDANPIAPSQPHYVQHICAADVSQSKPNWSVTMRTLTSGLSAGVNIVEVDNGRLKFTVVPTRGMSLWRATANERTLGWRSPVRGPVHPAFVPIAEPSGLGWLAGFDELMCRCGLVSNGAPEFDDSGNLVYPIHGRIANLPAHDVSAEVDDIAGTITVCGTVEEARFHFAKLRLHVSYVTKFESTAISWHDRVINFGGTPTDVQMLYHTNIGLSQLNKGSQLIAPTAAVTPWEGNPPDVDPISWPHYQGPRAGRAQECYYLTLLGDDTRNTRVLLKDATSDSGVGLRFNLGDLPYFTQWKNEVSADDGYVTGLEPALNYPNQRSYELEHGRVQHLSAGEAWEASLTLDWHLDADSVKAAEAAVSELQGDHKTGLRS